MTAFFDAAKAVRYHQAAMEKVVRKYRSFEEADAADREFYKSLSGDERLDILLELIRQGQGDDSEFKRVYRIIKLRDAHNS